LARPRASTVAAGDATAVGAALRGWNGAMILGSHDVEFVVELAPDRVLLMPDAVVDHWSDDLLDLVALA
jgi:ATPase subunit of ABC transporter with duplicated ATPase domains